MACPECEAAFVALETVDTILLDSNNLLMAMAKAFLEGDLSEMKALGPQVKAMNRRARFQVDSIRKLKLKDRRQPPISSDHHWLMYAPFEKLWRELRKMATR